MRWLPLALLLVSSTARAETIDRQAIVIGANDSVDRELPSLRFADDDALRFAALFRRLGIETQVLTRPDESTRALHADELAGVRPPTAAQLREVVAAAAARSAQARARGEKTVLYVVFAGHGNARRDQAYLTLEDERLSAEDLLHTVVEPVGAAQAHVIIDACHSYLFAMSRGPGGSHRPVRGFLEGALGTRSPRVGFLVSSSQSGETHEWEAFGSGVFSHEVRSGLTGAADADGDGRVSYREIAAFVLRANAAIVNEHYRPAVHAHPPRGDDTLVDLRGGQGGRMRVDGPASGKHFLVEDARGVRWADFHARQGQAFQVLLPTAHRPLYVRDLDGGVESVIEERDSEVVLGTRSMVRSEAGTRGAAQHVFRSLFTLPFDRQAVDSFELQQEDEDSSGTRPLTGRTYLGIAALAAAAGAAAGGTYFLVQNRHLYANTDTTADQQLAADRNQQIGRNDRNAWLLYGASAAAAATGLFLLLWPSSDTGVAVSLGEGGAGVTFTVRR